MSNVVKLPVHPDHPFGDPWFQRITRNDPIAFDIDVLCEAIDSGNKIPDSVVRDHTLRYIREDFEKNGHKYSAKDYLRIDALLASEAK